MRRSLLLLLICWLCALPLHGSDFEDANLLYDQGKFSEAKERYENLVAEGKWSANLFYNLGNAHQRLGAPGEAILDYERALLLDPGHAEARANLNFMRGQTGAVTWPVSWMDWLVPGRWSDAYAVGGAVSGWIAVFLLARILLTPRREKTELWIGTVAAALIAGYAAAAVWYLEQNRALAIVTAPTAEVHLAPAESATAADALPAGSHVRVLSERGDWIYCERPTQGRGWIPAKALERVRLGAS